MFEKEFLFERAETKKICGSLSEWEINFGEKSQKFSRLLAYEWIDRCD